MLNTLCTKETLLVLSNFLFCCNVFKSRLLQRRQKASVYGKGINYSTDFSLHPKPLENMIVVKQGGKLSHEQTVETRVSLTFTQYTNAFPV